MVLVVVLVAFRLVVKVVASHQWDYQEASHHNHTRTTKKNTHTHTYETKSETKLKTSLFRSDPVALVLLLEFLIYIYIYIYITYVYNIVFWRFFCRCPLIYILWYTCGKWAGTIPKLSRIYWEVVLDLGIFCAGLVWVSKLGLSICESGNTQSLTIVMTRASVNIEWQPILVTCESGNSSRANHSRWPVNVEILRNQPCW